jgi:alpha-galactosidase
VPILLDEERRLWALQSGGATYAMAVDEDGRLRHRYFGPPLPRLEDLARTDELSSPLGREHFFPWESPEGPNERYEFAAWGGMYYHEPCLKATFDDGVRDVRLVYERHETRGYEETPELVVTLRDPHYALRVRLHFRLFEELDLLERYAVVENAGLAPITLEQVLSAAWHLPRGRDYRLTHLAGRFAAETQIWREHVSLGKKVLESRRGNTSHHANPFFAVDRGTATEERGEVWFGALGWSGNWKIVVEHDAWGVLQVSGGINDFDFAWHLEGGETFETPSFVGGYTEGGFGQASRNLHRYARKHILPSEGPRPVLYNSWEATYFDINEEVQGRLAEKAASLGVELFVVDDGWFGERNDDRRGLGDWWVNPEKFPRGLGPLIQAVHSLGMDFGLWVEPEMVNPDSDLYREHPDWVYYFPNRPRTESRNQLVLNLAKAEVRNHLFSVLDRLLTENEISFIKWDMNRPFSEPGWPEVTRERQREVWVRHVRGVYEILERLRQSHPGVAFESCSSGGGRVDLGILRYTDQVWTSDNTDPFDRLKIQEGCSMAYPARAMMCWVADPGFWAKNRRTSISYRFHSAMMGSLGIGTNLLKWSEEELGEASKLVQRYKEVRDVVQEGDQYRLLSPRGGETTAVQYVSEDKRSSVIFVFRNPHQFLDPSPKIYPRGLEEGSIYRVTDLEEPQSGGALMGRGIEVALEGDLTSVMIELTQT